MTVKHEWEISYLVKAGLYADADAVWRNALNALFALHPEQKLQMITAAYRVGDISLGKAAELMGVSSEEMKDILRQAGISLHLGLENADELREELKKFESN